MEPRDLEALVLLARVNHAKELLRKAQWVCDRDPARYNEESIDKAKRTIEIYKQIVRETEE